MAIDRSAVFELTAQKSRQISFDLAEGQSQSYTLLTLRDLKKRVERKYDQFLNGDIGISYVLAAEEIYSDSRLFMRLIHYIDHLILV